MFRNRKCYCMNNSYQNNSCELKDDILEKWNYINLYSKTRGINRFDGEYQILEYVNQKYMKIDLI